MDKSDKDRAINPSASNLLKDLISPVTLNLPSAGQVDVFCGRHERQVLIEWFDERSIARGECIGSQAVTIYDLQNLGLSDKFEPTVRKNRWEERKTELEQFIFDHHWPIRPVGNTISVQLGADDVSFKRVKSIITTLLQNDLLDIYQCRCHSSDFQLIISLPADFSRKQAQIYMALFTWLSTKTRYYYQINE